MSDLVVASLEAWNSVWRRNQHLVAGLLRRDPDLRVLFVEPATDPLHALTQATRPRRGAGLREALGVEGVRPGQLWLLESTKWLPRRIDRSVDERWARHVVAVTRSLRMADPMLWVNDPSGAELLEATSWRSLYDITDDWTLADRPPAVTSRIQAQESLLLSRCNEVVVCSPALARSKVAARGVTLIPNGVDSAAYSVEHPRPGDLPSAPVALYAGTLHGDRLDVALCARVGRALAGRGQLVLLGPDALEASARDTLREDGVALLGARPSAAVPAYLQHADVLVVPHVVTPFTDSLDPIKLYEYRAAGRPVVATPVAGFRDLDDQLVTVAPRDSFPEAVLASLPSPGVQASEVRPTRVVADLDWARRVDQMADVLVRVRR